MPASQAGRRRFESDRPLLIEKDLPRGGRPRNQREQLESEIIRKTTQETPRNATHWSTRTLAKELGVTQSMIHRVWKANGLKPHLIRTFKLSRVPHFEEKLIDVVGLYLNPPGKGAGDQRRPKTVRYRRLIGRSRVCLSFPVDAGR